MWKNRKTYQALFVIILVALITVVSAVTENARDYNIDLTFSEDDISQVEFTESQSYVKMIDVGQGDCTLVRSYNYAFLIDCGTYQSGQHIVQTLLNDEVERLEFILISHPHLDHMGGFISVASQIDVGSIIIDTTSPYGDDECDEYSDIIDYCEENEINIIAKDTLENFTLGDFKVEFLPEYSYPDDENDRSIITRVTAYGTRFLFTGDMTKDYEKYLIKSGVSLSCEVLKVAHHGSRYSSCNKFLEKTGCQIALISAGLDNPYNHPHSQVLERLNKNNITYYRTDLHGDITVNPETLAVKCEK